MNMEQMKSLKKMREDLEQMKSQMDLLTKEIKELRARKKPGPKPKAELNAVR